MYKLISIKDIFKFLKKSKIKAGEGLSEGKYPFYTSSNTLSRYLDYYEIEEESIILGTGGNASVHYCEGKFSVSTDCYVIQPKIDDVSTKYVYYYLSDNIYILEQGFKGAGLKHISKKYLQDIKIPLPPLQIQEKIVEVLDKAQELIDLRKKQIELVDSFIDCIFYDMFGDPVKNPKGWKKEKLGNLCDVYRGSSPRPINKYLGGTIPWIKIGDATEGDNVYMHSTKEHIIEEGVKKSRLVKKGSLIFANCGVSLGFARIITFDGCIHDGWLSFENIDKSLDKLFLLKLLNFYTDYFRKIAPDGTQPNLNTKIMKFFEVIVPPLSLQLEFQKKLNIILSKKQLMQESLDEMEKNYNSLMQRAFRGELFY